MKIRESEFGRRICHGYLRKDLPDTMEEQIKNRLELRFIFVNRY